VAFAAKGGFAASVCYFLVDALAWPGLQTSIWTCLFVAQSSFGAIVQKSVLRLAGASLGGLIGLLAIVAAMPNMESLAPMLVVVAAGMGVGAWITTGSSRISYAGVQTGFAFGLCLLDVPGTVTDLSPARDRVLGVLLGIVVAGVVYRLLGPVLASDQMRRAMASTLRSLAGLARVGIVADDTVGLAPARGHRWTVYSDLATTLRLTDEARFEAGAGRPTAVAERSAILRLATDAQAVLLAALALVRHRLDVDLGAQVAPARASLRALALGIVASLDAAAERVGGATRPPVPELDRLLAGAEEAVTSLRARMSDARVAVHLDARVALYRDLVGTLRQLGRDLDAPPPVDATL